MRLPLLCLFLVFAFLVGPARAAEPFFKKNDVIALVGGEDMVVAGEYGYLELLLVRALPDYHLRFRNFAWEGDTVFEQPRDLNFPTLEEALDRIGATVVICQFGQMESLAGKEKLPEFIAAYEKLVERFSAGGKRRIVIIPPSEFESYLIKYPPQTINGYLGYLMAGEQVANRTGKARFINVGLAVSGQLDIAHTRDGIHLNRFSHFILAQAIVYELTGKGSPPIAEISAGEKTTPVEQSTLEAIRARNKLWFNYWRPQNWAFLAGDRVSQPSSRDWRDPSKRWFPAEREEFLPLIEAKEKEIDALAEKLAGK